MTSLLTLRILVVVELVLAAAYFYFTGELKGDLPLLLQPYLKSLNATSPQWPDNWPVVFGLFIVALNVVALIGLFVKQKWARSLYLVSAPALLLIGLFLGPKVDHAVAYTIDVFSVFVMGLIVSHLLYKVR